MKIKRFLYLSAASQSDPIECCGVFPTREEAVMASRLDFEETFHNVNGEEEIPWDDDSHNSCENYEYNGCEFFFGFTDGDWEISGYGEYAFSGQITEIETELTDDELDNARYDRGDTEEI